MSTESPVETLEEDVQARLMRMLDSVRLEKQPELETENVAAATGCSNCGSQASWGNASWCPDCGYYPKLGRAVTPVEAAAETPLQLKDFLWLLVLVGGGLLLLIGSLAVRFGVSDVEARSHWAIVQILLGFTMLCIAQVQAYLVAAQTIDSISASSLFFEPVKLWEPVFKSLPKSQRTLQLGAWSVLSVVLALAVVGVDVNSVFGVAAKKKKPVNPMKTMMKVVSAAGNAKTAFTASEEEAAEEQMNLAGNGNAGGPAPQMSMEDAMRSFADDAGAQDLSGGAGNMQGGKFGDGKGLDGKGGDGKGVDGKIATGAGAVMGNLSPEGKPLTEGAGTEGEEGKEQPADGALANAGSNDVPVAEGKPEAAPPEKLAAVSPDAAQNSKPAPAKAVVKVPPPKDQDVPLTAKGEARTDRTEFIVFGFLTNPAGDLRSVLLADIRNDRLRFVGKMAVDDLSDPQQAQLQTLLKQYPARSPLLETPYRAKWVQPVVKIRVGHIGWTSNGEPRDGYLMSFEDLSSLASR